MNEFAEMQIHHPLAPNFQTLVPGVNGDWGELWELFQCESPVHPQLCQVFSHHKCTLSTWGQAEDGVQ